MAIISTLRDKMGKFLVVVVGFSIAAFVLGDILGPNSSIGNPNQNIVGEINGEEIDLVRFNSIFEQLSYNFSLNNGRSTNTQEIVSIRDQAWEKLINDISYVDQYNELGIVVTDKESVDMVLTFRNLHNWLKAGLLMDVFNKSYAVLKPGGIFGVVEHRALPGTSIEDMNKSGYVTEKLAIEYAEKAGFVLIATSEINANPKDGTIHPKGVWTLPPSLRLGNEDKEKYIAIGESDRMTLKFIKPE